MLSSSSLVRLSLASMLIFTACRPAQPSRSDPRTGRKVEVSSTSKSFPELRYPCTAISRETDNKHLWVFDLDNAASVYEKFTAASLQGIVNKTAPSIWLKNGGIGDALLDQLKQEGWEVHEIASVWELVEKFREDIKGAVVYSTGNESVNSATSISGIERAIIIESSLVDEAKNRGIPIIKDVSQITQPDIYQQYQAQLSPEVFVELPEKLNEKTFGFHVRDFAVQNNAFTFFSSGPSTFRSEFIQKSSRFPFVFGWGWDETDWVKEVSENGGSTVPSNYSSNLSALACLPTPLPKRPNPPTLETIGNERVVAFLISDGDNITWYGTNLASSKDFWQHPLRGTVPLSWEISPMLAAVAPRLTRYYFDTAKTGEKGENFVAASSGAGYNFANMHPNSQAVAQATAHYMRQSNLNIATFMHYRGDYENAKHFLDQEGVDAVIVKYYHGYHYHEGNIKFYNNKPLITVKGLLWENFGSVRDKPYLQKSTTPEGLVNLIAAMPTDPARDLKSFGVIVIHPWSYGEESGGVLSKLKWVVDRLPENTKVVSVEELVRLVNHYHNPAN